RSDGCTRSASPSKTGSLVEIVAVAFMAETMRAAWERGNPSPATAIFDNGHGRVAGDAIWIATDLKAAKHGTLAWRAHRCVSDRRRAARTAPTSSVWCATAAAACPG